MIFETESAQRFLVQEFNRRVNLNPRYSLRAYARALGLSSGALSEILRQRRPISLKAAAKIAKSLGLSATEKKRFYELIQAEKRSALDPSAEAPAPELDQKQLDEDTFRLVSEWQHFAILNLVDCENFRWSASHIAKRLGLGSAQAQLAMDLLVRLGLVHKKDGRIQGVRDYVLAPSGRSSAAIRQYHRQILEKAIAALEFQDVDEREVTGVGFAVDSKRIPQIKRELSAFQDQLVAKHSNGKKREVYFLESVLFRITQGGRDEND